MAGRQEVEDRAGRDGRRALRFLAAGPATVSAGAGGGNVLLDGGGRGTISVRIAALRYLAREALAEAGKDGLVLTPEGVAHARRLAAGDDRYRRQHADVRQATVETPHGRRTVAMNLDESPLAQLARRRTRGGRPFLSDQEFRAGERLRADYTRGRIMPRLGANWQAAVASGRRDGAAGGGVELTDAALAARQRVDHALAAVGPELAGVLVDVCCFLKGLEAVETERGWPVRSAKVVLKTALQALARHYEPARTGDDGKERPILHWGADDYRPSLAAR